MTVKAASDRSVITLDSAASVIAGVRRAVSADLRGATALEAEWRPFEALSGIAGEWRALAAGALEPNVFYDPAFALPAASVFGRGAGAVLVWSQTSPRRLLGFFPARIERARYGFPLAVLTGWAHPYAPLGAPLVARTHADATVAAWLAFLAKARELPGVMLLPFVPVGPFADALGHVLARTQTPFADFARHQRALLAPGTTREGYVARAVGHKKGKELRRLERRLDEVGRVVFRKAIGPEETEAALADFLALEVGGWKGRAGTAAALHPDIGAFMRQAVADLAATGAARIDQLSVGGKTIAAAISLRSGDTAWFWKIAYDEAFAQYSPGVLLTVELTERLLADPTIARVDSCAGADHPMINRLWRERLTLTDRLVAVHEGAPFAAACRLESLRRTAIAAAKSARDFLRQT
jgi:CelD/BcsL family acetyltransferase involved in cellulose biosynthesis